jgi:major membrane immunogen (membrane-anchored lipoprotein)
MKKRNLLIAAICLVLTGLIFGAPAKGAYRDGEYSGTTRSIYYESYYGKATVRILNGNIQKVDFIIFDSNGYFGIKNEIFDSNYEIHYQGNPAYVQQCREDWKGAQEYPKLLLEKQDINKVDSISGATWSYNLFRDSVLLALTNVKPER